MLKTGVYINRCPGNLLKKIPGTEYINIYIHTYIYIENIYIYISTYIQSSYVSKYWLPDMYDTPSCP